MKKLLQSIRLWAIVLVVVGIVDLAGALSQTGRYGSALPLWPIVELLVGAAGFYFTVPAVLPAFSLLLIWDDLLDLLAGTEDLWVLPSLLLAGLIWRDYRRLRRQMQETMAQSDAPAPKSFRRSRRALPLVSLALGLLALPLMWLLLLYLNTAFLPGQTRPAVAVWLVPGLIATATAGIGFGVGSLQAGYPGRLQAYVGVTTSGLAILSILAIGVLNSV